MSILYDPVKKKPKVIIYVVLGVIPIILVCALLFGSKDLVEKHKEKKSTEQSEDIFDKF